MAAVFTREELQDAALLLVVAEDGTFRYSSTKSNDEIAAYLRGVAVDLDPATPPSVDLLTGAVENAVQSGTAAVHAAVEMLRGDR